MSCTCRMETGGTFDEQLWIQCDHCRELDERDIPLRTCDGCETPNLAIGDDCTMNKVGACLCFDCLRQMDENERALWDEAFSVQERVAEVLHG